MFSFRTLTLGVTMALTLGRLAVAASLPPDMEEQLRQKFEQFAGTHGSLFDRLDPNDYRQPFEKKVLGKMLENQEVKDLMPDALKMAKEVNETYHKAHLLEGVLCSDTQFPEIQKMAREIAASLQMKPNARVYVMNSASMNAYTWSIDQDNYGVALFSGIIKALTREELKFVLAHEMGHVKSKHVLTGILLQLYYEKYEKLPPVFASEEEKKTETKPATSASLQEFKPFAVVGLTDLNPALMNQIPWFRKARNFSPMKVTEKEIANFQLLQQAMEYSSDRAGIVASGKRQESMMGLVKLASGHVGDLGGFSMDAYLAQIESVLKTLSHSELENLKGNEGSHAFTLMRVGELDLFYSGDFKVAKDNSSSGVYREILSAYTQISDKLLTAAEALKKFRDSAASSEMNALERRWKEKDLTDVITPRQSAESDLNPLVTDPITNLGLAKPNVAFDAYVAYARARKTGVPVKPITEKLIEKIKFEIASGNPTPEEKEELEKKLKVAEEIKVLKPGKPATSSGNSSEEDEKKK